MSSIHDIWRGDIIPESGVEISIGRNSLDFPSPVVPLLDVHLRRAELHDSGVLSNSGIISYNSLRNRLELIPSNSGAQPIVTAVLWDGYDTTGGTTVGVTTAVVTIDTERVNTHPNIFVHDGISANAVQINMSGVYEFDYSVSIDSTDATLRSSCRTGIQRSTDGGTVFTGLTSSSSYTYNRLTAAGKATASAKVILEEVAPGTLFRVTAIRFGGVNCTTIADASRFTIRKLA
jgi:hypothetical protein